jgi:hypothetical protein
MYAYLNAIMSNFRARVPPVGISESGQMTGRFHKPSALARQIMGDDDDSRRRCSLEVNNGFEIRSVRRAYLTGQEVALGAWLAAFRFSYVAKREQVLWLYISQGGVLEMRRELYEDGCLIDRKSIRPLTSGSVTDFITRFHEASQVLSYGRTTS